MKLKNFIVELHRPDKVYLVGDNVSGVVKVWFEESTKLQTIELLVKGKAETHWNKDDLTHDDIDYDAKEDFIRENVILYGNSTGEAQHHPPGEYSYPFSVQLVGDLPCSFEGKKGFVRYTCDAMINRSTWTFNKVYRQPFTVIRHLDCNQFHNALNPIVDSIDQKVEGLCCCKCSEEGSMSVKLNINKTAFVPGEPLIYEIFVDNRSANVVKEIELILRQNTTFYGLSDSMLSSGKLHDTTRKAAFALFNNKVEKVEIPRNQCKTFKGAATIPSLPPSKLEGCTIIDVQYNVILVVENSFTPVKFKHEVIIGTIPTQEGYQMPPPPPTEDKTASPSDIGLSIQPTIPQGLPPSYAECVFGKVDVKEKGDGEHTSSYTDWAPAYTYYDWNQKTDYGGPKPNTPTFSTNSYNDI